MTAQILYFSPPCQSYSAPMHTDAERIGDAWRITRADLAEDMLWIGQYSRSLAMGAMTAAYRAHVERALASRVRTYLAGLRQAHMHEMAMDAMGVEYVR